MLGQAFKRSLRSNEPTAPRVSDLPAMVASTTGKIELESVEEGREFKGVEDLIRKGVTNVFRRYYSPAEFDEVLERFDEGYEVRTGSDLPSAAYGGALETLGNMGELIKRIEPSDEPAAVASAIEFLLEGLHLNRKLNRDQVAGQFLYRG